MANQQHVDMLLRDGVHAWNRWRKEEPDVRPDLHEADLHRADLHGADLHGANLYKANLFKADLPDANLRGCLAKGHRDVTDYARWYEQQLSERFDRRGMGVCPTPPSTTLAAG